LRLIVFVHPPTIDFSDDVMDFDAQTDVLNWVTVKGGARRQDSVRAGLEAVCAVRSHLEPESSQSTTQRVRS